MSEPRRTKVVLVDRMQYFRFPRSKKRRIRAKWRKRAGNYRPLMVPVGTLIICGSEGIKAGLPQQHTAPYDNEADPSRPYIIEMHTKLWEKFADEFPEAAANCDLFKRIELNYGCVTWPVDLRCSKEDYSLLEPIPKANVIPDGIRRTAA